ncbi:MAG: hypothetical protein DIZ77_02545 [endosymbiont of Seepiophila jonesi]|uniref:cyclic-guanylate-specific phosphodiesterase n=1 Tax=endosymbiont of Lamellibrachia luymesi TaxID=2200907 RepID=A0A370DA26_9GAMM|nr:MAG: hypothetical protein DIZ79_18540 [endosymbiont of Lamellibrachia luymesi]RDH94172.1 MAG: hypothetical protein DIZ77_02545 [endosymbiont of Seepiophila jonesi]
MTENIVQVGSQHVADVQDINKNLVEKTLRMRCLAYLSQVKSQLLIETIHDMNNSRQELADLSTDLAERTKKAEKQRQIIEREMQKLGERNKALEVDRDLLELKVEERTEAFEKLAHYDSLTNLPNRFLFNDRLKHALARADRENSKVGLLLIDLDRFKNINDTAGHPVGDELLRQVGQRILLSLRTEDTLARLGGDEFAVILESIEHDELAAHVAHKIQQNLLPPFELTQDSIYLTASIGISLYPGDAGDPVTLLKNADTAMYRAKAEGKNTFHFYTRELTASANSRFSLENQLRMALERDEFELFYQPQFDLNSGRISGAEALIRWNHSERGLVSPAEFIWLAEETGLIIPIGAWVIKSACHQAKKWFDEGRLKGRISANLSALQIMQENTYSVVRLALEESGLPPDRLELEITESALIGQLEQVSQVLDAFKSLGIALAIDDFGTGYSSLAYLKRFHIDRLKIDRSFVRDIPGDPNDMAIIRAIIAMGHTLGLSIVAEGVETEPQANFLTGVGCNDVQGYFYGKPVPCDQFQI